MALDEALLNSVLAGGPPTGAGVWLGAGLPVGGHQPAAGGAD